MLDRHALLPLLPFLPEDRVGAVQSVAPLALGLSGASVYGVTTSKGAFVLRIQRRDLDPGSFAQQVLALRRAAEAGIAPALVHVDESARATVSERIFGPPITAVLADPDRRPRVLGSVVERLRRLRALDRSGIDERDPLDYARRALEKVAARPGFPSWASSIGTTLEEIAAVWETDPRRVLCHHDLNPGNILWDEAQAWLVDWEMTGVGHPYYDLATLALFLQLPDEVCFNFAALLDGGALDEPARQVFRAARRLVGLLCGLTFLDLAGDLSLRAVPTIEDAPSLADCYAAMRRGELTLGSPLGQVSMGFALIKPQLRK